MNLSILFAAVLLMFGGAGSASAELMSEEEQLALVYGDQATVSIATGSKQLLRRAPSVATMITAEDIKAMGATDMDQVLETVPGIHVSRADWRFTGGWLFSAQVNRVEDRRRAVGDTRPKVPDYTTLDMTLRTTNNKNEWDFAASVRNLFNADVREPSLAPGTAIPNDLPMAPRSLWLQAVYAL